MMDEDHWQIGHLWQSWPKKIYLLCLWIIFWPQPHKLIQMVWTQNWPVSSQIVKIVHDNSHKQIDDL